MTLSATRRLFLPAIFLAHACFAQTQITLGGDTTVAIKPLLGVNMGPRPNGESTVDLTSAYQAAGVTMVRTHDYGDAFDMSVIFPNQDADPTKDSSYNWTASDVTFRQILAGGFEPYIRLGDSYGNSRPVTNPANWSVAAVTIIRRYSDATRWGRNALRYVEIYNEPDNAKFWSGTSSAFYQLYITASKAIKAAFPALKVGGCGFTRNSYTQPNGGGFVRGFLSEAKAAGAPLDFLSWHTYATNPADYTTGAQFFHGLAVTAGYPAAESILSEWNTDIEHDPTGDPALRTGARGASILTAAWINLQASDVVATLLYRGPDPSPAETTFFGLWYSDGKPKPGALALTLWSQVAKYATKTDAVSSSVNLGVLAARNAAGERVVLIVNNTGTASSWQIAGTTGQATTFKMQQIADSAASITTSTLSSPAAAIPAYGVQLVTLSSGPPALITGIAGAGGSIPPVSSITSGGYFTIYGSGFATTGTSRFPQTADIANNTLPTNLAGVCVNVNSARAFLSYVSPTQLNVQAPGITTQSIAAVAVVLNCGLQAETVSATVNVTVAAASPEFLYFTTSATGQNPVAATKSLTGSYVGPAGLLPGATFTPAKAGDLITLYGIGFGPTSPVQVPGVIAAVAAGLTTGAVVTLGGVTAPVSYAGISPGSAGLYQINIAIPLGVSAGNQAVSATINGVKAAAGATLAIQ